MILIFIFPANLCGQNPQVDDGVSRYNENGLQITYDNFTTDLLIITDTLGMGVQNLNKGILFSFASFEGTLDKESESYSWGFVFIFHGEEKYFNQNEGIIQVPFLADSERFTQVAELETDSTDGFIEQLLHFDVTEYEWETIKSSNNTRFRIGGNVTKIPDLILDKMLLINEKVSEYETSLGIGNNQQVNLSPYELSWEGDIDRSSMIQPLPDNPNNSEGVVTVRFEVKPDGTVGRIIPLRKMNPELEREVTNTLRSWKFSRLPGGVPQQTQWGTITFRFVVQ
ncbi:MAG: TonB family protein [Gracilimonas sp.]|nr:TonB family protein [Gracilimonas sp.]